MVFSGELWPIHPQRFPDELLSFWIMRVAHANQLKLQTFSNLTFGRSANLWNGDVDRYVPEKLLLKLGEKTGATLDSMRAGMLTSYEGCVFDRHNHKGLSSWVLPLGIYHRTRQGFGVQYCPECLFWDEVPYFRKQWRLSFATVCYKHRWLLHDRCPSCESPVIYFRNDLGGKRNADLNSYTTCWRCGYDYRFASHIDGAQLDAQSFTSLCSLLTFIEGGLAVSGPHFQDYAPLFLAGLASICRLLVSHSDYRRGQQLRAAIYDETGFRLPTFNKRVSFDSCGLKERHQVLQGTLWLLEDWPDRFIRVCRKAGVSRSELLRDKEVLPFWIDELLLSNLSKKSHVTSDGEAAAAARLLAKQGQEISERKVLKLLGRRNVKAVAPYKVPQKRSWPSSKDLGPLLVAVDKKVASVEVGSRGWLLAERNKAIVLVLKHKGWNARRTLGLDVNDMSSLLEVSSDDAKASHEFLRSIKRYLYSIRPHLVGAGGSNALFVGWKSDAICQTRLRQILKELS